MKRIALKIGTLAVAAGVLACGSDNPTEPLPPNLAGNYTATQFVTTGSSGQTNQLLAGSSLNITLNSNGTTSGHLHLAASGGNPAFDADMAGTWTHVGNIVDFTQTADSFVRDMDFTVVAQGSTWSLVGDDVFAGTRIQLTLTQS